MTNRNEINYGNFKFQKAISRRITNSDLLSHLDELVRNSGGKLTSEPVGKSFEKREIRLMKWGIGTEKILMWSQMHGNEPTATLALLDTLNFFNLEFKSEFVQNLYSKISLFIVPMLNPDGAERFQRRNALGIDLNRDALALQSPESQTLKEIADKIKPQWGFNLHDQNPRYSVGSSGKVAAISLLAPAFDSVRSDNAVRDRAKKLCGIIADEVESRIGKHVGKYSDDFGPRCFGDNMQKWGVSTVLIESGGLYQEMDKPTIRELNFHSFLTSFESIANQKVDDATTKRYEEIPFNGSMLADLKLERVNLIWNQNENPITVDLAINYVPMMDVKTGKEKLVGIVYELGDMHILKSIKSENWNGKTIQPTSVFLMTEPSTPGEIKKKILEGFCTFIFDETHEFVAHSPANFIHKGYSVEHHTKSLSPGERASFRVLNEINEVEEVWINGFQIYTKSNGWQESTPFVMPNRVKGLEVEL